MGALQPPQSPHYPFSSLSCPPSPLRTLLNAPITPFLAALFSAVISPQPQVGPWEFLWAPQTLPRSLNPLGTPFQAATSSISTPSSRWGDPPARCCHLSDQITSRPRPGLHRRAWTLSWDVHRTHRETLRGLNGSALGTPAQPDGVTSSPLTRPWSPGAVPAVPVSPCPQEGDVVPLLSRPRSQPPAQPGAEPAPRDRKSVV